MKTGMTRREFNTLMGLAMTLPLAPTLAATSDPKPFRIRTITAGLRLGRTDILGPAREALAFLEKSRKAYATAGYEVQTLRMATQPLAEYLPNWKSAAALKTLKRLDRFAVGNGLVISLGPVITGDRHDPDFSAWAAQLIRQTRNLSFSARLASTEYGIHRQTARSAAEAIRAIAAVGGGGEGNFRFAATAFVPAGTPFFPAAWFSDGNTFSIGLESPNLLTAAFAKTDNMQQAASQLKANMERALAPVASRARALAKGAGWKYLGIDASPAPGLDASIGKAIEALTGAPFGSPSTLAACATITGVLKHLDIERAGYSGLMLPVLEDPVLAKRSSERRYGIYDLLLYSSVCGTGLDVVPLPGDTPAGALAAVITDVAALAHRYHKALSARLFPVPGKAAGETVTFDNPYLTSTRVMSLGRTA